MIPEQRDFFHWLSALIALPAAAYAGQPFFQSAFRALRAHHVNMDVPITIGVTLAVGLSLYETAIHATHAYFAGALTVRVTAVGAGTLVEEVERLLDKATQARSQTVQLADRAARLYAPVVH